MVHPPRHPIDDPADAAIARVLCAEAEAGEAIARCEAEAEHIAEAARARIRALTDRTDRRIRAVVSAFERERAARLAEIEAEASAMAGPPVLSPDMLAGLERAVRALACELSGGAP